MPANDSYEFDYTPGYQKPTHEYGAPFGDEFHAEVVQELLLSMAGYTQRGVTLAGGQGVLPTGTVLARHAASGKYFVYNAGATTDGRAVALGVLRDARDTGGTGYASNAAFTTATGITLAGSAVNFPASPAGKIPTDCQGNLVYRGLLNANLVSGGDITSIVGGTGGGIGSGATGVLAQLGARIMQFGGGLAGAPFPGGPMDGDPGTTTGVNAFVF